MDQLLYSDGNAVIVTTYGPGKLHVFFYGGSANAVQSRTGFVETTRHGVSHFIIGFSLGVFNYAMYWEGKGEATCSTSTSPKSHHVGKSWADACLWDYGKAGFRRGEVAQTLFNGALQNIEDPICYLLPEKY